MWWLESGPWLSRSSAGFSQGFLQRHEKQGCSKQDHRHENFCTKCLVTNLGNNTARSDRAASADCNARKDYDIPAQPTILANGDGFARFRPAQPVPNGWIKRMRPAEITAVWPSDGACPYGNGTCINPGAIVVDEDIWCKSSKMVSRFAFPTKH